LKNPKERPRLRTSEMALWSSRRIGEGNAGRSSGLTTELAEEHKEIVRQSDLLNVVEDNSKLNICIRLQQLFAQHCAKEQRLLYPLLRRYLDSNVCKLLTQEHKEISNAIRKATEQIRDDNKVACGGLSQLDQLLRPHFSKEENVLFWYLDLQLVDSTLSAS